MTRREEDQLLTVPRSWSAKAAKRKVRTAPERDSRPRVALDRLPIEQRLLYGFSLMALDEDGVYGENYE